MEANTSSRRVKRRWTATLSLMTLGSAAALVVWREPVHGSQSPGPPPTAEFCLLAPGAAHAVPSDMAEVALDVVVPPQTPGIDIEPRAVPARQGDVVRVAVASPREGGVAVHGLLDVRPVHAGQKISVEFRAIYSGRFPVHFHGDDGSHVPIAAVEVLPAELPGRQ